MTEIYPGEIISIAHFPANNPLLPLILIEILRSIWGVYSQVFWLDKTKKIYQDFHFTLEIEANVRS